MNDEIDQTVGLPCKTPECPNLASIFRGGMAYLCAACATRTAKQRALKRRPSLSRACKNGHEYRPGSWKIDSRNTRICLICQRAASKRYRERRESQGYYQRWVKVDGL